jgi:uncharacterized protein YbaP (TraB family)
MRTATLLLICLSFLALATSGHAQAPVWKVSYGENYFYLAGSVHQLRESDTVPEVFEEAYRDSQLLVLENICTKDSQVQYLPQGELLSNQLNKRVYDLVNSLLGDILKNPYKEMLASLYRSAQKTSGSEQKIAKLEYDIKSTEIEISITQEKMFLDFLNPYAAIQRINSFIYKNAGYKREHGLEAIYNSDRAKKDKKSVRAIEACGYASSTLGLRRGYGNKYILDSIQNNFDLDAMPDVVTEWQKGKADTLNVIMERFKQENPEVYGVTITERNANWLPVLDEILADSERAFVLVGFSHLVAPSADYGLLENLRKRGYTVEQLD